MRSPWIKAGSLLALLAAVCLATACAVPALKPGAGASGTAGSNTGTGPAGGTAASANEDRQTAIFIAVLRHQLTIEPAQTAYVLDVADDFAADPIPRPTPAVEHKVAISLASQARIRDALDDLTSVVFVGELNNVMQTTNGCAQIPHGVLITLGPPVEPGDRVTVPISAFRACLDAVWQTYVVERGANGWAVTGTTGPVAIA